MRSLRQNKIARSKKSLIKFCGLDRRVKAGEEYFPEMTNMSGSEKYCAEVRPARGVLDLEANEIYSMVSTDILIDGVIRENAFIVDAGNRLRAFYEEDGVLKSKDIMNTTSFTTGTNTMICSGGYLYFFPDKKYINLMNIRDSGSLDASTTLYAGTTEMADGTYFYETVFTSSNSDGTEDVADSGYVKVASTKNKDVNGKKGSYINNLIFALQFNVGDYVHFSGVSQLEGVYKVAYIPNDYSYMVVSASISSAGFNASSAVTLSRNVPDMDYVVASGNRLWGCRYGVDDEGKPVNEIYASRLGDAKNWNVFEGISTDSYVASIGEDGIFTGATVYEGDPLFFKEDCVIRIYGSVPSDFTILTSNIRGIEKGSSKSAVIVDDTLYYKTYSGIVAYNGGMPYNIDEALGDIKYSNAVAGSVRGRYYICMQNSSGEYELFVYDTVGSVWYREDSIRIRDFCRCGDEIYMVTGDDGDKTVLSVYGTGNTEGEGNVAWKCITRELGADVPYRQYVTKAEIRFDADEDSNFDIEISYNGEDKWRSVASLAGNKRISTVSARPLRCDSFRLRFSGTGYCRINSVVLTKSICGDNRQ